MIGIDWDGTIISQDVAREANTRWFSYMEDVLGETLECGKSDDWYPAVMAAMGKLKGKKARNKNEEERYLYEVRLSYNVLFLEVLANNAKAIINEKMVQRVRRMKKEGMELALITTNQTVLVTQCLAILGLGNLFDEVCAAPQERDPPKQEQLELFLKDHELELYIGDSDEDEEACKELGVVFERA